MFGEQAAFTLQQSSNPSYARSAAVRRQVPVKQGFLALRLWQNLPLPYLRQTIENIEDNATSEHSRE